MKGKVINTETVEDPIESLMKIKRFERLREKIIDELTEP